MYVVVLCVACVASVVYGALLTCVLRCKLCDVRYVSSCVCCLFGVCCVWSVVCHVYWLRCVCCDSCVRNVRCVCCALRVVSCLVLYGALWVLCVVCVACVACVV